jgi:hypothetical protein
VPRSFSLFLGLLVTVAVANVANAQNASPSVTVMQAGGDRLLQELKYVAGLTTRQEQALWNDLIDPADGLIPAFMVGIDPAKPVRVDILLDALVEGAEDRYITSFPIANQGQFINQNLFGFGINAARVRQQRDLYKLTGDFRGFMQIRHGYATIGDEKSQNDVQNYPNPREAIDPLVQQRYSAAALIRNRPAAQDMERRRQGIRRLRENLLAGLKPREGEAPEDFELRRLAIQQQMDEMERFFVESSQVMFGWRTDLANRLGLLDLDLAAIEGTDLEASIRLIGREPSHFANFPRSETAILSGRINFPLDELRRKHLTEFLVQARPRAKSRIQEAERLQADQRQGAEQVADLLFDMLAEGAKAGILDGAVEVYPSGGDRYTMVGGVRSPDGTGFVEVLRALPRAGQDAEIGIEEVGNVSLHRIPVPAPDRADFQAFFGGEPVVYFGTSPDAIWYAAGENALEGLKTAINRVGMPVEERAASDVFIDLMVRLKPWLEQRQRMAGDDQGDVELRRLALESFQPQDDRLVLQVRRAEDRILGRMQIQEGVFRLAGKIVAQFVRENLR